MSGTFGRRDLVRVAGAAGIAGVGAAALSAGDAKSARPAPVTAESVREHGAKGDGATDDAAAIQRALDAAGRRGGSVYFPPGDYLVGSPLRPCSNTVLMGSHTPRWRGGENPPSDCKLRATGRLRSEQGLIEAAGDVWGVTVRNLALVGDGQGDGVHGLRFPPLDRFYGNESWILDSVTIAGFTGSGLTGCAQTTTVIDSMVHDNRGFGLDVGDGVRWNDCHFANCFFFFNRHGNVRFTGRQTSGLVEFVNCRFERAGTNPLDLFDPLDPGAPGVRIENARYLHFVNCTTDANCGNGFEIASQRDTPEGLPSQIGLVNCHLSRDGSGDNRVLGQTAGISVRGFGPGAPGPRDVSCVNCFVTADRADDTGKGDVVSPRYGARWEHVADFKWIGGAVRGTAQGSEFRGDAEPATLIDPARGLTTLPLQRPADGYGAPDGSAYLDAESDTLYVRSRGEWRPVKLGD